MPGALVKPVMGKMNRKGRSKYKRFVGIFHSVMNSDAFLDLPPIAVRILLELCRRYNGINNGEISLSCREAAEIAHCGKNTASTHIQRLAANGLVKITSKGRFTYRQASEFEITFYDVGNRRASNDWRDWKKS